MLVMEIRKSIACLIALRTKQSCLNHFSLTWLFFSTCDLQLWTRTGYHLSYCDQSKKELICSATYSRTLLPPAGKGLTTWFSYVMLNCVFVTFPCGILGQVRYMIVLTPDLCTFYCIVPSIVQYSFNDFT